MPVVISGPTFPICARPVIIPKSAELFERSLVHKTGCRERCPPAQPPSVHSLNAAPQFSTCLGLLCVYLPIGLITVRERAALFPLILTFTVHTGHVETGRQCTCDYHSRTHIAAGPDAQKDPLLPVRPGSHVYIGGVFRDFI